MNTARPMPITISVLWVWWTTTLSMITWVNSGVPSASTWMISEAISTSRQMRLCFSSSGMNQWKPKCGLVFQRAIGILDAFGFERQLECRAGEARGKVGLRHGLGLIGADLEQDHAVVLDLDDDGGMVKFAWLESSASTLSPALPLQGGGSVASLMEHHRFNTARHGKLKPDSSLLAQSRRLMRKPSARAA